MTNKVNNYIRGGLAVLAIATLSGCGNSKESEITYEQLTKSYGSSPIHSVVAEAGRTQDGLTSDTTKGVPTSLRRWQFMIDNRTGSTEIEAGKRYLVHDYTNTHKIKDLR